ncbi:MAG: CoA-binding protein [Deltaproteobacteria bacterium]|nr:CoA-binding protein [Deltaproteobacteria bacterium]
MPDSLFKPKSVAIIGASMEQGKTGSSILSNLVKIFPVNPESSEIIGFKKIT